jgi:parallel beta-helix repeat protein
VWLFDGATANEVRENTLAANARGIAITLGGAANRIEGNSVSGSREIGIRLSETGPGNRVTDNLVVLSGEDGIAVNDSPQSVVGRNSSHDNGDDGIDIRASDVLLFANVTAGNGHLGIEAPPELLL